MPIMSQSINVIKYNAAGKEVWHYSGEVLRQDAEKVILEAYFRSPDQPFMGTELKQGDRFIETYYFNRWYNIFEIHDRDDDHLKGWYCNITRPAVLEADDRLSYQDLALDLWVDPDGTQTILDEDEFEELELDPATRACARGAMEELKAQFTNQQKPGL